MTREGKKSRHSDESLNVPLSIRRIYHGENVKKKGSEIKQINTRIFSSERIFEEKKT
jgi:hypothetical protein